MSTHNVNFELVAKQNTETDKNLDKVIKKLKEIEERSGDAFNFDKGNKKEIDKINKKLKEHEKTLKSAQKESKNMAKATRDSNKAFGSTANMLAYSQALRGIYDVVKNLVGELSKLDKPVFDLGVVSGKTTAQIEQLKFELLATASTVPQTSEEIAQSLDLIVRTGRDLEESMEIVQAGMQLATSSGEDLHFITETLAKSLVGFGLGADSADEAIDRFYSTVLKTPTSMQGLSNAMKNSTAAFSTLSNLSQKSGADLEEYNEKLLNLSTAMTGQLALLGNNFVCRVKTSLTAGKYQKVA